MSINLPMGICSVNWLSMNVVPLLLGFILGIGASVVASLAIILARFKAKKELRRNINVTLMNKTIPYMGATYWCVELRTIGGCWNKVTFNEVLLELYAKVRFEQLDNGNKCLGLAYDATVDIEEKSILFKLKAGYPKQLAIMYRPSIGDWLLPFRTTMDFELTGDWNMEICMIEDGQIIYSHLFPKYIQDSKPVIENN